MSAPFRDRRRMRRLAGRALVVLAAVALTATLAGALQVREVRVTGARRFPSRDVENVLRTALGTPTIAARASALRASACAVSWVADATVRISLDGVVTCAVVERTPVAVAVDGGARRLVDGEGRVLAPAPAGVPLLELDGFGAHPAERAAILAVAGRFERSWNGTLRRVERLASRSVALEFAGSAFPILADPICPEGLAVAHRVLDGWLASGRAAPLRIDARLPWRIALTPAPPAEEGND